MGIKQLLATFFLSSLLLANIALAQVTAESIWNTILSLLLQYVGIIFILIFILILLIISGVIKPSLGGFSPSLIIFLVLIILAFVLPQFITFPDYVKEVPDSFKAWKFPPGSEKALSLIGLPETWAYVPAIIYLFILPFAAIYTLFWAFLVTLAIFPQPNVNRMLALIVAFLTIPMGWFIKMVWALFSFMGIWSVAVFAVTFIAGIFFKGAGVVAREHAEFTKYVGTRAQTLKTIRNQLETLVKKQADAVTIERTIGGLMESFPDYLGPAKGALEVARAAAHEGNTSVAYGKISEALRSLK